MRVELDCPPSKIKTILKLQIKKAPSQKREAHFYSDNTYTHLIQCIMHLFNLNLL